MDPDIAVALRRAGIDVTTTNDAGLRQQNDDAQFEFITGQKRVFVTDDVDFIERSQEVFAHPGIVCCRRTKLTIGQTVRYLMLLHGVYKANDMRGQIELAFPVE